jgi:hypothetical protein
LPESPALQGGELYFARAGRGQGGLKLLSKKRECIIIFSYGRFQIGVRDLNPDLGK